MKVLKGLFLGIIGLIVVLAIVGLFLPSSARVERSIVIDRPASLIFPVLNSFERFNEWSPWYGLDPAAEYSYSGPSSGVGARMDWKGNEAVGVGTQTITASEPDSRIATDLDFGEMGVAKVELKLTPEGQGTRVTWGFQTDFGYDLVGRYFGLLMDRFVGADYEKGLVQLKALVETFPNTDIAGADIELIDVAARPILYVTASSSQDLDAISKAYADAYGLILPLMNAAELVPTGPVLGIDNYWDDRGYGFDAAIPVARTDIELQAPVQAGQTYAGRAVRVRYVGAYAGLGDAQSKGEAYIAVHKLKAHDRVYTEFVSDPGDTPEDQLISVVYLPVE
ncbi:MAG: SRPBCC family protein [Rhodanobacteraceae bacterium]|nr:SRPBCC family protein [Rhodanobacteraceae bacterium]